MGELPVAAWCFMFLLLCINLPSLKSNICRSRIPMTRIPRWLATCINHTCSQLLQSIHTYITPKPHLKWPCLHPSDSGASVAFRPFPAARASRPPISSPRAVLGRRVSALAGSRSAGLPSIRGRICAREEMARSCSAWSPEYGRGWMDGDSVHRGLPRVPRRSYLNAPNPFCVCSSNIETLLIASFPGRQHAAHTQ
jgi:hypothetical protein